MSVQGNIKAARSLAEPLRVGMDTGRGVLVPIENKRSFLEVAADVVEHVDPVFVWGSEDGGDEGFGDGVGGPERPVRAGQPWSAGERPAEVWEMATKFPQSAATKPR